MTVEVEILDGDEEARLAFLGATQHARARAAGRGRRGRRRRRLDRDRGRDARRRRDWSSSFLVGSGALADHYLRSDRPTLDELRAVRAHACDVFGDRAVPRADCAVAVGGSAASLRRVVGDVLDGDSLEKAIGAPPGAPAAEVAERLSLDAERVRLMPAGILILDAAAQRLGQPLQIGRGGLREGACCSTWRRSALAPWPRPPRHRGRPVRAVRDRGRAVVRVRADELFEHAENVLDTSDIERVHDMRVASRRLRAVLEIFEPCFPQGDFKTVLRDVKALADALGERRDPDVHIEDMEEFEKHVQARHRPGIEALVARLRARQAARQRHAGGRARARRRVRPARAPALARRRRRGADRREGDARSRASTRRRRSPTTPSGSCACGSTS